MARQLGNSLQVDETRDLPAPLAHLRDQIGAARERPRAVGLHGGDGVLDGGGARIGEVLQRSAPARSWQTGGQGMQVTACGARLPPRGIEAPQRYCLSRTSAATAQRQRRKGRPPPSRQEVGVVAGPSPIPPPQVPSWPSRSATGSPAAFQRTMPPRSTATSWKPAASSRVAARAERRSVRQTRTIGVALRAARSPPVAPHPASRRRSCLRLHVS